MAEDYHKLYKAFVVYRVALLPWKAVSSRHPIAMDNLAKNIMETFSQTSKNSAWLQGKADNFNEFDNRLQNLQRKLFLHRLTTAWWSKNCTAASNLLSSPRSCLEWLFELPGKRPGAHLNPSSAEAMPLIGCPSNLITSCSTASPHRRMLSPWYSLIAVYSNQIRTSQQRLRLSCLGLLFCRRRWRSFLVRKVRRIKYRHIMTVLSSFARCI